MGELSTYVCKVCATRWLNHTLEGVESKSGAREFWNSQETDAPPNSTGVAAKWWRLANTLFWVGLVEWNGGLINMVLIRVFPGCMILIGVPLLVLMHELKLYI